MTYKDLEFWVKKIFDYVKFMQDERKQIAEDLSEIRKEIVFMKRIQERLFEYYSITREYKEVSNDKTN